ncbi:DUF6308 family protein [Micromonospora sediminicola]|uniref:DUF6308 family protein n=1 Tax=Micromonospora sediminicola TaxID=946078 RepID=UPI0033CE4E2C
MLDDEQSRTDLQRYFAVGPLAFSGSQFEVLGGGPRAQYRDVVTADDLIAVEMLNVRVPPMVALDLLQGSLGERISDVLRELPTALDLSDARAKPLIDSGGPAERAWKMLVGCSGVNKTIASKILARKRPRLVPVYDNVVACALRGRPGFWLWLHEALRAEDLLLARRLQTLRVAAGIASQVSEIRVLDVIIWMRHVGGHRRKSCLGMTIPGRSG